MRFWRRLSASRRPPAPEPARSKPSGGLSTRTPILGLAGLVAAVASCTTLVGTSSPQRGTIPCCTAARDALELQYLGTGGWLIRYGRDELLTAPFFSNPSAAGALVGSIKPDTTAIDAALAVLEPLDDVRAVLVGHAHYDHLLDVPRVLQRTPSASVFGSNTMANILAGAPGLDPTRVHSIEDSLSGTGDGARWVNVAGSNIRFLPLLSDHAPHFQGIEVYDGEVLEPLRELPNRASGWRGGTTLAYLIDFLDDDGSVAFRIHYVDAAASFPGAMPPVFAPPDYHRIDVQILCAPSYAEVDDYPEGIIGAARPRVALVGHWEDFFAPWTQTPDRSVRGSDLNGFTNRLRDALPRGSEWTLPNPGDWVRVQRDPA